MSDTQNNLEEANQKSNVLGKFKVTKDQLTEIAYACQEREFSEEVDKIDAFGGEQALIVKPMSNSLFLGRISFRFQ